MNQQPPHDDPWGHQPQPPYPPSYQQQWRQDPPPPPAKKRRTGLIAVAAGALALVIVAAVALVLLRGNQPDTPTTPAPAAAAQRNDTEPAPTAEPKTKEAAKAAALRSLDAYAAGDWEAAWDEWVPEAQKLITRDQYVRLHTECETLVGIPFTIKSVRVEGTTATVRVDRAGIVFTEKLRYLDGVWRYQPRPDNMADYRLGIDKLIAKRCPKSQ